MQVGPRPAVCVRVEGEGVGTTPAEKRELTASGLCIQDVQHAVSFDIHGLAERHFHISRAVPDPW